MSKSRALGAAGAKGCRYGCIYCFTQNESFVRCPRFDKIGVSDLLDRTSESSFIQPSIDTELLLLPNWKEFIDTMAAVGKPISFATKTLLTDEQLDYLSNINKVLKSSGNFLNVGVTIVKLYDWQHIEPKAPSPYERIETLKKLYTAGIYTTVLMRPLIPTLSYAEIDELVKCTKDYCYGYLDGPLYLNEQMKQYFKEQNCEIVIEELEVDWQEGHPFLEAVKSHKNRSYLEKTLNASGKLLFDGNTEAMSHIRKNIVEKYYFNDTNNEEKRSESVVAIYLIDRDSGRVCMIHDRSHGRWIPIGGQILKGESLQDAALRIVKEKLNVAPILEDKIHLFESKEIESYNIYPPDYESGAFCRESQVVKPVLTSDAHIHLSTDFIAYCDNQFTTIMDRGKVMTVEWFPLDQINNLNTFDNIKFICDKIDNILFQKSN